MPSEKQHQDRVVPMRLQKFLARAGVASRRGSEDLMTAGRVTVNGRVVTQLGSKVDPLADVVRVDGRVVGLADGAVTIMLHKPAGYVTTMSDPQGRPCVAQLVPQQHYPGLFPVGRLDRDSTGLLLFSTDGGLGHGLLRPRAQVVKRYMALVEGTPAPDALAALRRGVQLDDGPTLPAQVRLLRGAQAQGALEAFSLSREDERMGRAALAAALAGGSRSVVEMGLHEGRKHEVKRMLAAVGHPVCALHRTAFGPVGLDGLARGAWRELTAQEVEALHRAVRAADEPRA